MAEKSKVALITRSLISILLVIGVASLALASGWWIKDASESKSSLVDRGGVKAFIPNGWLTQFGIEGESRIFSVSDPFDINHFFSVSQMPGVPGGQLTDSVVIRNLQRGQELSNYQVLDQNAVKMTISDGFRVTFVYVQTSKYSKVPVVIQGVDYYQLTQNRVIVITSESQAYQYDEQYPAFIRFLNNVVVSAGG